MRTSAAGVTFIQSFEKLRLQRYSDAGGKPTIGFGHLLIPGEEYQLISREQADALFRKDLARTEVAVNQAVEITLAQHEFDSLSSLSFNIGGGNFARSTLVKMLNSGNTRLAAQQFLRWDRIGAVESPGLFARRVAEKAMFETGVYTNHV